MPNIREYGHIEELEEWIIDNWESIKQSFVNFTEVTREEIDVLELEEVIVVGEYGRGTQRQQTASLRLLMVLDIDGRDTSESPLFQDAAPTLVEAFSDPEFRQNIEGFKEPTPNMEEEFDDIQTRTAPSDRLNEAINRFVPIREGEPNRAYSITRDEDIFVTDEGISREPAGITTEDDEFDAEAGGEGDLLNYPDLDSFIETVEDAFNVARGESADSASGTAKEDIKKLELSRVVELDEFGNGTAEPGADKFRLSVFVNLAGQQDFSIPFFSRVSRDMASVMENSIKPTDDMKKWSSGIVIDVHSSADFEDIITNRLTEDSRAVDVFRKSIITIIPTEPAGFEIAEEPIEEPEDEDEPEEVTVTEEEKLAERFPDIPPELRIYADEDKEKIDIPINKDSKSVDPRPAYDFEKELYTPGDAGTDIQMDINEGIGFAKRVGALGQTAIIDGEEVFMPPSSFPRTGLYIKYHLLFRGPSYELEMYRDIVTYSGYISSIYNGRFVTGSYVSFREYLYRLKQVSERDLGPELIRRVPPSEARERGLELEPELPTGEAAPWLQDRKYYEVNQEALDHPAWSNVSEFLYGD